MRYEKITETIGKTPLMRFNNIEKKEQTEGHIFGKLEAFNPAGSIKDRAAFYMIKDAEEKGILKPGGTIIEPTSGNTGIGLASIAAAKGYRAIFVLPETMIIERRKLLAAYGAELVLTEGKKGMQGACDKAEMLQKEIPGSIIPGQFSNKANAEAHYRTTGPEIWNDLDGKVDIFVSGIGTGGTITGTGRFLKEQNPSVKIVAIEPEKSPLISQGKSGPHNLQGVGANFIPELLDQTVIDKIITIKEEDAYHMSREIARLEGYLCGISSGAIAVAALQLAKLPENREKNIVAVLPDTGERYLSTELFEE